VTAVLTTWVAALWLLLAGVVQTPAASSPPRVRQLFDFDWRFHAGEVEAGQATAFDDRGWEKIDLPHDFMIEGKGQAIEVPGGRGPGRGTANLPTQPEGPFNPRSPGRQDNGYLDGGVGWYRKTFTLPAPARGRRVALEFEGVYMNSEVWLNGQSLGKRPYGYSTFEYDVTSVVRPGGANVVAVRVLVQQPSTRWYSGAGIYRHVWLTTMDPVHITRSSLVATTSDIRDEFARVQIRSELTNDTGVDTTVTVEMTIHDATGRVVARMNEDKAVPPFGTKPFSLDLDVLRPHRWSIDDPYLYRVESTVRVDGRTIDQERIPLGIRTAEFTVDNGFLLNGRRVPLQGVCLHHDLGALGAAAFDRGIERQLEIMKSMGVNAIRTSHNPPAPALLDAADRLGFVVMDETFDEWKQNKTRFGYGQFFDEWSERDTRDLIRRDRNHPSVVMWSIGNEIPEQRSAENGEKMAARLAAFVHEEDPTRPVVSAMNDPAQALETGFAKPLDLIGLNYSLGVYGKVQGIGKILASETSSNYSSRDQYNLLLRDDTVEIVKQVDNHCTSYDLDYPRWGNTAETEFQALKKAPWMAGEFVWTGFDYIGEPTPFAWPNRSSSFGIVDLAGFPKDRFYLYQSQWRREPMVHLLPHWNWPDEFKGKPIPVWAYTNAESVELFLNDRSLGKRTWDGVVETHLSWQVPYEPGRLRAVASRGGKVVAEDVVETTGPAVRIELKADRPTIRADGQDLSFVTVRLLDSRGRLVRAGANHPLKFSVSGAGTLAGLDNGDPTNHESFKGTEHRAFNGLALAIVRASRTPEAITVRVAADGLAGATVTLTSR
jgi:beta-galactosidase